MSNFDTAIVTVFKHEGLFVNDPNDPGGATHYGISLRWLKRIGDTDGDGVLEGDIDNDGDVDIEDIEQLSKDDALRLYRVHWWEKYQYYHILHQVIATKVFDLSINMGAKASHRCVQRAIRAACQHELVEDGILGPKTLAAINNANPNLLLVALRSEAAGFYRSLNNAKYIKGWLNRAYA